MQSLPAALVKQSRTDSHDGLHGELISLQKAQHILIIQNPEPVRNTPRYMCTGPDDCMWGKDEGQTAAATLGERRGILSSVSGPLLHI